MTAPKLVGMVGKALSGKDTFANVLVREGGYVRLAFADKLKCDVARFLGVTLQELEARKDEFRAALQAYGSYKRRQGGSDHWIKQLSTRIKHELKKGVGVVITDVRYRNEAKFIHDQGGILLRRIRSDGERLEGRQAQHSSETELDNIFVDHTCICGTVEEIQKHAQRFLEEPMGDYPL